MTSGIESLFEEAEDVIHVVHTPQINDDLGYDSPKPTPKHPKLSSAEVVLLVTLFIKDLYD